MMHSTEFKEPFHDYRLIEIAFAQRKETKFNNSLSKWLLRDIVKNMLGDNISLAP